VYYTYITIIDQNEGIIRMSGREESDAHVEMKTETIVPKRNLSIIMTHSLEPVVHCTREVLQGLAPQDD
jgi:hypothetical protein